MPDASSRSVRHLQAGCLATALLLVVSLACSPIQRHAVLDFVFDGVPPYMSPEQRARRAELAEQRQAELIAEQPKQRRRQPLKKIARFTRGPFAANECTRCHDLTTASGFRKLGGAPASTRAAGDLAEAGRLRMPVDELCAHCHTDFTIEAPGNEDLWLHGPVASGWCILCHQPHSSVHQDLLTHQPTALLCSRCHLREDLVQTPEHLPDSPDAGYPQIRAASPEDSPAAGQPVAKAVSLRVVRDCTRCHDPHMGRDRLLLRPEDQWVAPRTVHAGATEPAQSPQDQP